MTFVSQFAWKRTTLFQQNDLLLRHFTLKNHSSGFKDFRLFAYNHELVLDLAAAFLNKPGKP